VSQLCVKKASQENLLFCKECPSVVCDIQPPIHSNYLEFLMSYQCNTSCREMEAQGCSWGL
jgi:hypothetical protein